LKRVALSFLPKSLDADVKKVEHFAIRDVARVAHMAANNSMQMMADSCANSGQNPASSSVSKHSHVTRRRRLTDTIARVLRQHFSKT
jgi:hypothetical protein